MTQVRKSVSTFRDLVAWRLDYELGMSVYRAAALFPAKERFGRSSQLRQGVELIASNIAEGYGRSGRPDCVRCLKPARGSLDEIDTKLSFARDLGYVSNESYEELVKAGRECERVPAGLIGSLEMRRPVTWHV